MFPRGEPRSLASYIQVSGTARDMS